MNTNTQPTINVTDWRGKTVVHTLESYLEAWQTGSIAEIRRLAMWQGEADDVVEMERLERELAEVRERIVSRDFQHSLERQTIERELQKESK
jgi:predicted esterase YcpF (UPF0227 family)